jgi:hypothetical protein
MQKSSELHPEWWKGESSAASSDPRVQKFGIVSGENISDIVALHT